MNLNEFFPYKVCINLDKRTDRWQKMLSRFSQHNIEQVVRFPALDGKALDLPSNWNHFPGAYGCLRSHLAVIEESRARQRQSVLIFEDDAVFDPQLNERFAEGVRQLPQDWDMVLFGGLHGEPPRRVSPHISKVTYSLSTYAYALKHTIYDGFIEVNRQALKLLDQNTRSLQSHFNCYCFMPHLAWVEEDFSDVSEQRTSYWWLSESLVIFGKEVDQVLANTVAVISYRHRGEMSFRNLKFMLESFAQKLPAITVLVVEQGEKPLLDPDRLPTPCTVKFLNDDGGDNRSGAFDLGYDMFKNSKDFFLFLDSDVFMTREDIIANLLKCREFDFATALSELCALNEDDTAKLLSNDTRWDYTANYPQRKKTDACEAACFFTNRGLSRIGGWGGRDNRDGRLTPNRVRERLRIFESPNHARRLYQG
jgi:GR25 family glycosyltransferase involved in LPS biosynthesis